jgi:hypothetical protein
MPLPPPSARELIHERRISCRGYRRADGLWEIEGTLSDCRAFDYVSILERVNHRRETPVHEMSLRLTLDGEMTIRAVQTSMDHTPLPPHCSGAQPNYQRLVGLRIEAGFRQKAFERVGGIRGCTHVSSLLQDMATVAFQTVESDKLRAVPDVGSYTHGALMAIFTDAARPERRLRPQTNGCHAHAEDGPVARMLWPKPPLAAGVQAEGGGPAGPAVSARGKDGDPAP